MDYKEFIDSVFNNFIVNDIYEEHYKETMKESELEYQRLIEYGLSEQDANSRVIEKYKVLKARLGFRLDRKKVEKSKIKKEYIHGEFSLKTSRIANVLFYIVVALSLLFSADMYGIIISIFFALPALFIVNIFVIKTNVYLLLRYQITSVLLLFFMYSIGLIMHSMSFELSVVVIIILFTLINALLCYSKLKVKDAFHLEIYKSWGIMVALDLSVVLFYFLLGKIILDGFSF